MAIFDIFKKKRRKAEKPKKAEKPSEEVKKEPEKKKEAPVQRQKPRKKETGVASLILRSAHITEKATALLGKNQYVFKVSPGTTKQEIKKAVEGVYGVNVLKVRPIRVKRKQRRLGRTFGWRKGYKKAIVTLKKGQKIEILPR